MKWQNLKIDSFEETCEARGISVYFFISLLIYQLNFICINRFIFKS